MPSARIVLALPALAFILAACNTVDDPPPPPLNARPAFVKGAIASATYDGTTNDLLTAGLGKSGLATALPAFIDPANPTVAELRRQAIYVNYRALVDMSANGGYGTLYGPNVDVNGVAGTGEGRIAGEEHIAFADDGTGTINVTVMVQIPTNFSTASPCIVTATSSGSRGIYGAIGTAGEWGLKRGCAVAYTDKGTGNGGHDLANNAVYTMQGLRTPAATAGANSIFTANVSATDLAAFNAANPNRWAFKHAHSGKNPEATWGGDTLNAVRFAFYMLNEKYGTAVTGGRTSTITAENTLVIASSVSNGGGAALAAAEQDTEGLIDAVAVAEPEVQMNAPAGVTIRRGATAVPSHSKTLYDYFSLANLLQPCAAYATSAVGSPFLTSVPMDRATNRCTALAAAGMVAGATFQDRANDAMAKLVAAGWEPEATVFQASHYAFATVAVTLTYANAYARAGVRDNLCGYSFGGAPAVGIPAPISANAAAQHFGTGNGVPPTSGIGVLNNLSVGGVALDAVSVSASTGVQDFNFDGANCLRNLFTGTGTVSTSLRANIDQVKRTGNLRGKPAVIVHGRSDTLLPVNHTSRPYYALNKVADAGSRLAYYEVTNAQHFEAFLAFPGYDNRLVPLHRYLIQALDIVWNNARSGTAIPPSQVVRTVPRGGTAGTAPAITAANVPPIAAAPAAADTITFTANVLTIPE